MKKAQRLTLGLCLLIFAISIACNISGSSVTPSIDFPTPQQLFNTPDRNNTATSRPTTAITPTPYPTPTAKDWPPPYFGTPGPAQITPVPSPAPVNHNPDDFNILLLGSDKRTTTFATDVMILVNIQPKNNLVTLLSIPRDLFVYIPGWQMNRVNGAFQHGEFGYYPGLGPALVKDTLLYNLGIEIDRYILVDFSGFEEIINILGGVDVPVTCPYTDWRMIDPNLDPEEEDNWHLFTVNSGVIHMDGNLALWYARSRKKSSDFDRNRRQQELIRALYSQALRLEMIQYIPDLYEQLSESVVSDFTLYDALTLAPELYNLRSPQIRSYFIDQSLLTRWKTPTGSEVMIPDLDQVYELVSIALGPPSVQELEKENIRVEIWNGTKTDGLEILAAERLNYAGYQSEIGQSDTTDYTQTLLYDFSSAQDPEITNNLLDLFGLDPSLLANVPTENPPVDFLIILGSDFDPCFDPKEIDR